MSSGSRSSKVPYIVLTTTPNRKEAEKISGILIREKAAACVTTLNSAVSHFWWKGKRERARESVLVIKTTSSQYRRVEALIHKHHPYDVPEVIGWPIRRGSAAYLSWLKSCVR